MHLESGQALSPSDLSARGKSFFFYLTATSFLFCLVLGGATKAGHPSDAALQIIVIPLFLVACWRLWELPKTPQMLHGLIFCAAIAAVPLIQLLPLPPIVWTHLPGRDSLIRTYSLLDHPLEWRAITMAYEATWLATLAFLPAAAIFLAVLALDWRERKQLAQFLVIFAVGSGVVGLLQAAQGSGSPLRFYDPDDPDPVGFFVNRNHLAALLYCAAVIATALALPSLQTIDLSGSRESRKFPFELILSSLAILALTSTALSTRSRAGVFLIFLGLCGLLATAFLRRSDTTATTKQAPGPGTWRSRWAALVATIVGLALISLVFIGWSSIQALLDRFEADPLSSERPVFAKVTFLAAKAFMPMGSGLGSFVPVYQMFEKPKDLYSLTYANHAHNDLLELALETGLFGLVLLGLFLFWLLRAASKIWAAREGSLTLRASLASAATIAILLLFIHSLVDYPLRTSAMASVLAFLCALLIDSPFPEKEDARAPVQSAAHRRSSKRAAVTEQLR